MLQAVFSNAACFFALGVIFIDAMAYIPAAKFL